MAVRIRTANHEQPRTADNSSAEPSKYGQGFYSFDVHKVRNKMLA